MLSIILCVCGCGWVLNIQPVKEFRPPMSEVVESLNSLLEKLSMAKGGTVDGNEEEEKSFRSTYTRFIGSPELTYSSPGLDH
jgi:hypothetical protein